MRSTLLLPALLFLSACSSSTAGSPTATTTTETSAPAATTSGTISAATPDIEGLLLIESDSGDAYHYVRGSWNLRYDGPGYDDESASTFAESATTSNGVVVVGVCCEPVIGALLSVQPESGEVEYRGYGTRPTRVGSRVVSFRVEFLDAETAPLVSLLIAERFAAENVEEREIILGNFYPGARLVAIDDHTVAFVRSDTIGDTTSQALMVVDIDSTSGGFITDLELPRDAELAANEDGQLYVFSATGLYQITPNTSPTRWSLSATPVAVLPTGTFAVAVRGATVVAAANSLHVSTGAGFTVLRDHPPVWVGW